MTKNFLVVMILAVTAFLASCKGKEANSNASEAGTVAVDTNAVDFKVDSASTILNWVGSKPAGKHTGTLAVSNGKVSVKEGNVVGGEFTIDMNSIKVTDLKSGEGKEDLEAHLKGTAKKEEADHFFNIAKFPTAKFAINKIAGVTGDSTATHLVYGNLTIKDVTKEISFKANINTGADNVVVTTQPFNVNRTDFNVKHASKTFFDNLKDKFVDDNITVQINLTAKK